MGGWVGGCVCVCVRACVRVCVCVSEQLVSHVSGLDSAIRDSWVVPPIANNELRDLACQPFQ